MLYFPGLTFCVTYGVIYHSDVNVKRVGIPLIKWENIAKNVKCIICMVCLTRIMSNTLVGYELGNSEITNQKFPTLFCDSFNHIKNRALSNCWL